MLKVLETVIYGADLEAMETFYGRILGLEFYAREPGRHSFFRAGEGSMVLLFHPNRAGSPDLGIPRHGSHLDGQPFAGHVAFTITPEEAQPWRDRLRDAGVAIESEVDWPAGGHSIYFRDPAGNSVELAWGLWR